jgi:hypothetical protein
MGGTTVKMISTCSAVYEAHSSFHLDCELGTAGNVSTLKVTVVSEKTVDNKAINI